MRELTDAELWVLLSLDAESYLHELLMPIDRIEGRQRRRDRPSLEIAEAAAALASLAERGFVEIRMTAQHDYDWDRAQPVAIRDVRGVVGDPVNWSVPSEHAERRGLYLVDATDEGEGAYRREMEQLERAP